MCTEVLKISFLFPQAMNELNPFGFINQETNIRSFHSSFLKNLIGGGGAVSTLTLSPSPHLSKHILIEGRRKGRGKKGLLLIPLSFSTLVHGLTEYLEKSVK